MGLPKGKTNNPKGRTPGAKTKRIKEWEKLGEFITDAGAKKFIEEIKTLDGLDYVNAFAKVLSYFRPQLARTELKDARTHPKPTAILVENLEQLKELNEFLEDDEQ